MSCCKKDIHTKVIFKLPSEPYWVIWRSEQTSETYFTFGASSPPRKLVHFQFCFLLRIKQMWPCLKHLPLGLALLLASLTFLLCLCCPFQPNCLSFPILFVLFLLTCKSPVLRQIWLDKIIFQCSSQHKYSDILRENSLRSPNKNQGVQGEIV